LSRRGTEPGNFMRLGRYSPDRWNKNVRERPCDKSHCVIWGNGLGYAPELAPPSTSGDVAKVARRFTFGHLCIFWRGLPPMRSPHRPSGGHLRPKICQWFIPHVPSSERRGRCSRAESCGRTPVFVPHSGFSVSALSAFISQISTLRPPRRTTPSACSRLRFRETSSRTVPICDAIS